MGNNFALEATVKGQKHTYVFLNLVMLLLAQKAMFFFGKSLAVPPPFGLAVPPAE